MLTRIISGLIGIICTVFIVQFGGIAYTIAIALLAAIAWREYARMLKSRLNYMPEKLGLISIFIILATAFASINGAMGVMLSMAILLFYMVLSKKIDQVPSFAATIMGVCYIAIPFYHMLLLRGMGADIVLKHNGLLGDFTVGAALLWIALIGTWASDSFAYFTGVFFGKTPLSSISPKKSVEGLLGGIIGTVICVELVGTYFGLPILALGIMGLGIAVVGTLGDLVESSIKRYTGIKDSGNIIPGHGGVLDRFDSLLFTAPFVYLVAQYLLKL